MGYAARASIIDEKYACLGFCHTHTNEILINIHTVMYSMIATITKSSKLRYKLSQYSLIREIMCVLNLESNPFIILYMISDKIEEETGNRVFLTTLC